MKDFISNIECKGEFESHIMMRISWNHKEWLFIFSFFIEENSWEDKILLELAGNGNVTRFPILEKLVSIPSYESDKIFGFQHDWPVFQMSFSNIKPFCFHHPFVARDVTRAMAAQNLVLSSILLIKSAVWKTKIEVRDFLQPQTALFSNRNVAVHFSQMWTRTLGYFTREQWLSHLI